MDRYFSNVIIYGFLTYAAVFMLWSFLSAYGLSAGWPAQYIGYAVTAIAVFIASRTVGISALRAATLYGAGWTVMHFMFDAIYTIPLVGFAPFLNVYGWVGYSVVFLTPFVAVLYASFRSRSTAIPAMDVSRTQES